MEPQERDGLKALVRSMADHLAVAGNATPEATESLVQNAIEPLCPFNETDLLRNPPTEQQLRGQWDVVSFHRTQPQADDARPSAITLEKLTHGALRCSSSSQHHPSSISLLRTWHEVEPSAKAYHTVYLLSSSSSSSSSSSTSTSSTEVFHAYCIIYGTYEVTASSQKRPKSNTLVVTYTHVSLAPATANVDDARFLAAFGVAPQNVPLPATQPSHRCNICVVYVDHDMRIQYTGDNHCHVFLLRLVRRQGQGLSIRFAVTSVPMEEDAFVLAVG